MGSRKRLVSRSMRCALVRMAWAVCVTSVPALVWTEASGGLISGPITSPTNGHEYFLLTQSSWQDAQAEAVSLGGNLVTINDAAEQGWVFTTFGSYGGVDRSLWIGLNDAASEGNFVWVGGEVVTYTNWLPGQPDNAPGEDYVHILRTGNGFGVAPGFWNDLASPGSVFGQFDPIHGVVEVASVPEIDPTGMGSVLALVTGALGLLERRRLKAS